MTEALDQIGLYVIDCNMSIQSHKQYSNLEDLKYDVINNQASIVLDVDCFIGKSAWRLVEPIPEVLSDIIDPSSFLNEVLSVDIGDVLETLKKNKKENETFDS